MTAAAHPGAALAERLRRLETIIGEFRQIVEAGVSLRQHMTKSEKGMGSPGRVTLHERRAAGLPHLGPNATGLNSRLRAELYAAVNKRGGSTRTKAPRGAASHRHRTGRNTDATVTNALDLRATIDARTQEPSP